MSFIVVVLGIESSCDETAVAIVDSDKNILSNTLFSQIDGHIPFGGVVPEVASRSHVEQLPLLFSRSLAEANLALNDISGIAVTAGPGLIGGVIVGLMFAKTLAAVSKKALIAVNHLEGHALTIRLTHNLDFPYLLLLLSGGHCQILAVIGVGNYKLIGETIDDAVGEAFDKVARMLGLGYPGGPIIEQYAAYGDPMRFTLPKPLCGNMDTINFSFSGLKTAVKNIIVNTDISDSHTLYDLCASLQYTIAHILQHKLKKALSTFQEICPGANNVVMAGGVAANCYIREHLSDCLTKHGYNLYAPPKALCTDNGAMIAWAGIEMLKLNITAKLDYPPRSRWPLSF